jgi:DNA-binding CsgD family transcriptional regulator
MIGESSDVQVVDDIGPNRIVAQGSSGIHATDREMQVAQLVSYGMSHKAIGRTLGLTSRAVAAHCSRLASKIDGNGNARLKVAVWYLMHGDEIGDETAS